MWYVYWRWDEPEPEDPYLEMWHVDEQFNGATYSQLKDIGLEGLAKILPRAPVEDLPELLEYVREFCLDVEADRSN